MPRTKPAAQRRADLLAAARTAFIAKGVEATTLEDITSGAGVSKGLFWQYFRSKDEVVFALQQQYAERFADAVRAAVAAVPGWPDKLDACVETCLARFRDEQDLHDVLFRHTDPSRLGRDEADRAAPPAHNALIEAIAELLTDGAAAGAYRIGEPLALATLLYAALHAFDPTFAPGGPSLELLPAARSLFRRAVGLADRGDTSSGGTVPPVGFEPTLRGF